MDIQIAAGLKELHLDSAFTHIAGMESSRDISKGNSTGGGDAVGAHADDSGAKRTTRRQIPVERSGGGT